MTRWMVIWLGVTSATLLLVQVACWALPEGAGLAARYPGDKGLGRDPAVVFADSFDGGDLAAVLARWQEVGNAEGKVLSLSRDVPAGSADGHSLQMAVTWGTNTTGYVYAKLPRELDTAFLRYYVKYDAAHFAYHCGPHFGGYRPATTYPQGDPGRPRGDEDMEVEVMPGGRYGRDLAPIWEVAGFWPDMRVSADGGYWGNVLSPARARPVPLDRWQCVEVMLKANSTPGKSDGELAFWLDGKLQMHIRAGVKHGPWTGEGFRLATRGETFPGFRWRTDDALKINFVWLLYNVMRPNPESRVSRIWYDNVVVSTKYVGPIGK